MSAEVQDLFGVATPLRRLLKDLKGLEHKIPMPFNALSSTLLFDSMGQKPQPK